MMRVDPRCRRLNELNDQYHALFRDLVERNLAKQCREYHLQEPLCTGDYLLLVEVGESGDSPASMAAISKRLNINPSTATRRVNRLLTDDLVTKSIAPGDERRYDLRLTDKGARFLDQMDEWVYQTIQKTYEPVTDEELRVVYQYMEKCISQLQRLGAGE